MLGGTLSPSDEKAAVSLMRVWSGVLASCVSAAAVMLTFFPDAYSSDEGDPIAVANEGRALIASILLFIYAVALWFPVFRIRLESFRPVVLTILLAGLIVWPVLFLVILREGVFLLAVGPFVLSFLMFGVPAILAVLLETKFRNVGKLEA
jgi:hypothetical protein